VNKLPFQYVFREVEKLYEKQFDESNVKGIEAHCEFIVAFLHACGWTEEEFQRADFGFAPLDNPILSN
jgi:hypothetical protein